MAEYIEREAVMQAFSDFVWNSNHSDLVPAPTWNHAVEIVRDIPAADVVEVVRCRDCAKREICRTSNTWAVAPSDDWYCADGERGMDGGVNDAAD